MSAKRGKAPGGEATVVYNTIKVRLYPTPAQEALFRNTFGCCRYLWNQMLADQERFYLETGQHFIPTPAKYKTGAPFLTEVDNQALTQEYNKLCQAFRAFFRAPETFGHPRLKRKKDDRDTFTACNHRCGSSATIYTTRDAVRMTKAGLVRAVFPRRPRSGWQLTRITVERTRTGQYYGALLYKCQARAPQPVTPTEETTLALVYARNHFYAAQDGTTLDFPPGLAKTREKLTRVQQQLTRMQPGSRHYEAAVQKYRTLCQHLGNQRRDFLHKQSSRIANDWAAVCLRDDPVRALAQLVPGGHVLDAGYGQFRAMLQYKLTRQGKPLLLVDRYTPTTKRCSTCGALNETLPPNAPHWTCPVCKARHQREANAAQNILQAGLAAASPLRHLR